MKRPLALHIEHIARVWEGVTAGQRSLKRGERWGVDSHFLKLSMAPVSTMKAKASRRMKRIV